MYLSEPVRRDIVADMSGCAEGTHEFERVKNDILYSRVTIPCLFFQCLESPVLNITTMASHWEAEPAVAVIAVADNDPDVSPMFLPEPAIVQSSAESAATIEAPEAGEPPLSAGTETLPNSPIIADSLPANSTASESSPKIEVIDSELRIPGERNDDIPQPSSSQSHVPSKIRRASSTVFSSKEKKKHRLRLRTYREASSMGDA
ncbi:hypothetical protein HYPSUDRAFT_88310 [Hypholoma sublateritium FD-334 SS-4]|uniref:Uncharacterized protein n=1 Tax=Hypholoma sublateritium (strain FD-334 SS-4) TaxID=945553 RepID=A0A0D2PMJ6_HYPSF|nr:hypothetical protein HYPSUDRAFT_88310 [Hypholoma sublateritium FD-334 SS-4]